MLYYKLKNKRMNCIGCIGPEQRLAFYCSFLYHTSMVVIAGTKDTFQKEVLNEKGIVFVDFYAQWCGPCKMTSPIIDELSEEYKGKMSFVKIDVDTNQELASQYNIFSIPTFIIFNKGKIISQFTGADGKEGFVREIKKTETVST